MRMLVALLTGSIFGLGLVISGMTDTAKVQGFLDFFGSWDPTLAFVMGGAILPMLIAWRWTTGATNSLLGSPFPAPPEPGLDRQLITGAVLFGVGWGLVGFCPGPALASLGYGGWPVAVFCAAMAAGMMIARPIKSRMVPA